MNTSSQPIARLLLPRLPLDYSSQMFMKPALIKSAKIAYVIESALCDDVRVS